MVSSASYLAESIEKNDVIIDIKVQFPKKTQHLWGRAGTQRERDLVAGLPPNTLPVLIGSGLGTAIAALLDKGSPVAVVDRETPILELTGLRDEHDGNPRVLWLNDDTGTVMKRLDDWRHACGDKPLHPLVMPLYTRLDRDHYGMLAQSLKKKNFSASQKKPSFENRDPRILMLTSQYFLLGEITAACERMGIPHHLVNLARKSMDASTFLSTVTDAVSAFRPDFVFTVNHLGVDREGILLSLLDRLDIPLASWFVDNPHLILYLYPEVHSPRTALFTWDADNIPSLKAKGFQNLFHLPLAADVTRFRPGLTGGDKGWASKISFVGNSMVAKTAHRLKAARPTGPLLKEYRSIAAGFGDQPEPSAAEYIRQFRPELIEHCNALGSPERTLAFETLITWESTRQYRKACLEQTLAYHPLIVGDKGWKTEFKNESGWRYHPELSYYEDLPRFYPLSTINFNCTSRQMKGAVNQRVFDVPAAGAFLLTDERHQMKQLFDPGTEVATYASIKDIPEQIRYWLENDTARTALVRAARRRVLAEHTYEHRVKELIRVMRRTFF